MILKEIPEVDNRRDNSGLSCLKNINLHKKTFILARNVDKF